MTQDNTKESYGDFRERWEASVAKFYIEKGRQMERENEL